MDKIKIKKTVAREVLLAFGLVVILACVWLSLTLRNQYYSYKKHSLDKKITEITKQLDTLPKNYLKILYDSLSPNFVVRYSIDKSQYYIPKKEEKNFLVDFSKDTDSLPKLLSVSPSGYSYFAPVNQNDSVLRFDFVSLDSFKLYLKNEDYLNKLHNSLSQEYELGTFERFKHNINKHLNYNKENDSIREELAIDKNNRHTNMLSAVESIWDYYRIENILITIFVILTVLVYPVRIMYFILKWSIRTLRH